MKSTLITDKTKPHLQLIPADSPNHPYLKENHQEEVESFEKAAFSLLAARTTGRISPATIDALILALQKAKCPQMVVQRSLETTILLSNIEGETSVCLKFDIANFGQKLFPGRTHRFWFTYPQTNIEITASTDSGIPLEVEPIDSSPSFREIRVNFPNPLEPSDQISYRIQYNERRDFTEPQFYDLTAWTLTNKMTMNVLSPENRSFKDIGVRAESADGYLSDSPPQCSIAKEFRREKLSWHLNSAKAGDRFRTYWTLPKR